MAFDTHAAVKTLTDAGADEALAVAVVKGAREASMEATGELITRGHFDTALAQLESRLAWRLVTAGAISDISTGALSFDSLVKEYKPRPFGLSRSRDRNRTEAKDIEDTIKAEHWPGGKPLLNPNKSVSETMAADNRLPPQPGRTKETGGITDEELTAALKKFRQHLEKVGYRQGGTSQVSHGRSVSLRLVPNLS